MWHTIHLSCFDSPNVTANGFFTIDDIKMEVSRLMEMTKNERIAHIRAYKKPVPYLLSAQFVIEKALPEGWGIEHPLFVTKVLGEFDESSSQTLVTKKKLNKSFLRPMDTEADDVRYIGIDRSESLLWEQRGAHGCSTRCDPVR